MIQIYKQDFEDTDTVVVNHNLDIPCVGAVRVIVDGHACCTLVESVVVSPTDPRNSLTVNLNSQSTGAVQLLSVDYVIVGPQVDRGV